MSDAFYIKRSEITYKIFLRLNEAVIELFPTRFKTVVMIP